MVSPSVLKMNHCSVRLDSDELTDDQRLKLYETLGDCAANIGQYTSAVKFYMDMVSILFNKIAIPNNKFQMASGQGSNWLIESPNT